MILRQPTHDDLVQSDALIRVVYALQQYFTKETADGAEYFLRKILESPEETRQDMLGLKSRDEDVQEKRGLLYAGTQDQKFVANYHITYGTLLQLLTYANTVIGPVLSQEIFGGEMFGDIPQRNYFGLKIADKQERTAYLRNQADDLENAHSLTQITVWALEQKVPPERIAQIKKEEVKPEDEQKKEAVSAGGIPLIVPLGGKKEEVKKEEEKPKTKEEEEKEKKEKEKKPQEEIKTDLQSLVKSDRAFRQEVERIQSALLHSIAARYGIQADTPAFREFSETLARHITPTILLAFQRATDDARLGDLLQGGLTGRRRTDLYIRSLIALQHNPIFQAELQKTLQQSAAFAGKTKDQLFKQDSDKGNTPESLAEDAEKFYSQDIEKEIQQILQKTPGATRETIIASLSGDLQDYSRSRNVAPQTFEDQMRAILRKEGLLESQIDQVFIRLQAYSLLRKDAARITNKDLEDMATLFSESFGAKKGDPDNKKVADALLKAFRDSRSDLGVALAKYMDLLAYKTYLATGNISAIYADPQRAKGAKLIAQTTDDINSLGEFAEVDKKKFWRGGHETVGLAFYLSSSSLGSYKQKLAGQTGAIADKQRNTFNAASKHREEMYGRAVNFRSGTKNLQLYLISQIFGASFGGTQTLVQEDSVLWQDQPFTVYLSSFDDDDLDGAFFGPMGFYDPDDGMVAATKGQGFLGWSAKEGGLLSDRSVGKAALLTGIGIIGTPAAAAEATEIIEKVEQLDNFLKTLPGIGALYDQFVSKQLWDKVDLIGKILKFVLSLGIINLIAQILGAIMLILSAIKFAGWALNMLSAAGSKLAGAWGGVKSWLSSVWNSLGKTADSLLRPVGQAATALNTVAGTVPSGAAIGYTTVGIVAGAALWQTLIFGPFLTNRPLSASLGELAGVNIIQRRPQPPDIGCFTIIDDEKTIKELANKYGLTPGQFTQKEIDELAVAGGKVFASNTYRKLLCGEDDSKKIRLLRSEGGYGGYTIGDIIVLYDKAFGYGQGVVDYTLVHESGHVINNARGDLLTSFTVSRDDGQCFPTYPYRARCGTYGLTESFAEAIAVYVVYPYYSFPGIGIFDFPGKRPNEFNWVQQNIFGGEI